MAKKLMMNNVNHYDAIVLCEDFYPNGQPFILWRNQTIDWDKYELYINIDITNITKEWQHILAISTDNVSTWSGNKLHIYGSPEKIRLQPILNPLPSGGTKAYDTIINSDKTNLEIIINKNNVYYENTPILSISKDYMPTLFKLLINNNVLVGSEIGNDPSFCIYNLVQLQPYRNRGE